MHRHRFVEANGIRMHVAEQGRGPLVLLLHGFPECWYSWRAQLPALASAGFHAVAPDLRGYHLTDKPRDGYNIETLVDDVIALREQLDPGRPMHLVGHDWGGVIAWQVAWRHPEALRSLAITNAPHPTAFAEYVRRSPSQMRKSAYMLFFQLPGLPRHVLTRRDASAVASAFRRSAVRPAVFSDADLAVYRLALLRPGAARSAVEYYRQAVRQGRRALPSTSITVPTLVLWGTGDPVLAAAGNKRLTEYVNDITIRHLDGCGHWTQQEQPNVVNRELLAWLSDGEAGIGAGSGAGHL